MKGFSPMPEDINDSDNRESIARRLGSVLTRRRGILLGSIAGVLLVGSLVYVGQFDDRSNADLSTEDEPQAAEQERLSYDERMQSLALYEEGLRVDLDEGDDAASTSTEVLPIDAGSLILLDSSTSSEDVPMTLEARERAVDVSAIFIE